MLFCNLLTLQQELIKNGGEGFILRNPNSFYAKGRSLDSLKVKVLCILYTDSLFPSLLTQRKWLCMK